MPAELSPTTLALQDWGRPALLRQTIVSPEPPHLTSTVEREVTVIPQTLRIDQLDILVNLQDETRSFLLAESALPPNHSWSDCQLIIDSLPHRVMTAEGSGTTGWILLETRLLTPPTAA